VVVTNVRLGSHWRNEEPSDQEGQDCQRSPQKHLTVHVGYSTTDRRLFLTTHVTSIAWLAIVDKINVPSDLERP
jgi:hypothetical protein